MKRSLLFFLLLTLALNFQVTACCDQIAVESIQNASWTVRKVAEGIDVRTCRFENLFGGGQDIYVADGDMGRAGVSLKFVSKADGTRKVVSDWAAEVPGAVAAINGAWFNGSDGMPIQFLRIGGSDLVSTHPNAQERGGIVINAMGEVACMGCPEGGWESLSAPNVMASEVPIVLDGQPYKWTHPEARDYKYYYVYRAPRSAIGVTADKHVLLVVADGRQAPRAIGVTYAHMADLLIALGAVNAVELDGGGSSTLWARGHGVLNNPSDGQQRRVAIGICLVRTPAE